MKLLPINGILRDKKNIPRRPIYKRKVRCEKKRKNVASM